MKILQKREKRLIIFDHITLYKFFARNRFFKFNVYVRLSDENQDLSQVGS